MNIKLENKGMSWIMLFNREDAAIGRTASVWKAVEIL